ncbi:MAG: hypothetical protein OJI67_20280, partial [Prosthecobacter sp.]|nr:hypothetical protein [Prosthecobacter sp.]
MKKRRQEPKTPTSPPPPSSAAEESRSSFGFLGLVLALLAFMGLIGWALWPKPKNYTPVPVAEVESVKLEPYHMPDEKAAFAEYAGSKSCKECHAVEFEKWETSHHGLAERKPEDKLDLAG